MRVIISTDLSPYAEFIPLVLAAWERMGHPCDVVTAGGAHPRFKSTIIPKPHLMPAGNLAKISRMITASQTPGVTMLSDADILPLNPGYFDWLKDMYQPGTFLAASSDAYDQPGRYPICYLLADRGTWLEIVNPNNHRLDRLLQYWGGFKLDGKDDPWVEPFSDESLLRHLLKVWNHPERIVEVERGWDGGIARGRVDRACWNIDSNALNAGHYIDAHMLRPLSQHVEDIRPLADYLGLADILDGDEDGEEKE